MGPQATGQLQAKEKVAGRGRLTGAAGSLQTYRHSHRRSLHHIRNLHAIFSHGSTGVITISPLTRPSPACNILRRIHNSSLTRPSPTSNILRRIHWRNHNSSTHKTISWSSTPGSSLHTPVFSSLARWNQSGGTSCPFTYTPPGPPASGGEGEVRV